MDMMPLLLVTADGPARMIASAAYVLMMGSYLPMLRFYGRSPLWAASVDSAIRHLSGAGGEWKGRFRR